MELLRAAEVGNVHTLRHMLQSGVNINYRHPQGKHTALHTASRLGRLAEVKVMIEAYGAQTNVRDQDFNLPVHLAAASGHTHVVAYFIDTGIATVTDWAMHWSLLHIAAFAGQASTVRLLLDRGADPGLPGMHGRLPLHRAAYHDTRGALACICMLLDQGVDINAPDDSGWTALHQGCERGNCAVIKALLERGASLQEFDACSDGDSPLIMAAKNGHVEAVELLLNSCKSASDCAAVVLTVNFLGESALHKAVASGRLKVIETLMAYPGAQESIARRDRSDRTPLDVARDLHDTPAILTMQGAKWTPQRHHDYPYQFKVAVRTLLMVACVGCRILEAADVTDGDVAQVLWSYSSFSPGISAPLITYCPVDRQNPVRSFAASGRLYGMHLHVFSLMYRAHNICAYFFVPLNFLYIQSIAGPWSLPSGLLQHIFGLMAYPFSSWHQVMESGMRDSPDSPADIIAANSRRSMGSQNNCTDVTARNSTLLVRGYEDALSDVSEHSSPADIIWSNMVRRHDGEAFHMTDSCL